MDADIVRQCGDVDPSLYARAVLGLPHVRVISDGQPLEEGEQVRARMDDGQDRCLLVLVRDEDMPEHERDEAQIARAAERLTAITEQLQQVQNQAQQRIASARELLEDANARLRRAQHDRDQAQQTINAASQDMDKATVVYRLAVDDLSAF